MNKDKLVFEMHRSDAITVLLSKENVPSQYTNLRLAHLLEFYYPNYNRSYLIRDDDIVIANTKYLSPNNFFREKPRDESI